MLWAAAAFAIGIVLGDRMWRPPVWWMAAFGILLACGYVLLRRRATFVRALALAGLVALGSLCVQARSSSAPNLDVLQFADAEEVVVTAHITHEGNWRTAGSGLRQVLDVETEQVEVEGKVSEVHSGVRVSFYDKPEQDAVSEPAPRLFEYGERLQFRGKLSPPHNYRNPGAFDYRAYLAEKGIGALGSAKAEDVEVLPGFAGHKFERWRSRVHRSVIQKVHALWPPADAALIDAMVVGEDAFLGAQVRTDFQRTGTLHVLVVSGMNVGIFAFTAFWIVRRFGAGEMLASVLTVLLSVGYAVLTDVGAPIWRATLMLILFLGARLLCRERSMLNAVGIAGLGLLVVDPRALFGASFQLTFLCVLLIAAVGMPLLGADFTTHPQWATEY